MNNLDAVVVLFIATQSAVMQSVVVLSVAVPKWREMLLTTHPVIFLFPWGHLFLYYLPFNSIAPSLTFSHCCYIFLSHCLIQSLTLSLRFSRVTLFLTRRWHLINCFGYLLYLILFLLYNPSKKQRSVCGAMAYGRTTVSLTTPSVTKKKRYSA